MRTVSMKDSVIWENIGELTIQNGIFAVSVYQSALFYGLNTNAFPGDLSACGIPC